MCGIWPLKKPNKAGIIFTCTFLEDFLLNLVRKHFILFIFFMNTVFSACNLHKTTLTGDWSLLNISILPRRSTTVIAVAFSRHIQHMLWCSSPPSQQTLIFIHWEVLKSFPLSILCSVLKNNTKLRIFYLHVQTLVAQSFLWHMLPAAHGIVKESLCKSGLWLASFDLFASVKSRKLPKCLLSTEAFTAVNKS